MKIATFVKTIEGWTGDARLYRLSEPHEGNDYVVVSATVVPYINEPETYIFAATEAGEVIGWGEMDGSLKGCLDHKAALASAGYEVG